jgi:hypothetical protein
LIKDSGGEHYKNNHVATVVSINDDNTITLVESNESCGGVVVRSLSYEEFMIYVNKDAGSQAPDPEKALAVLNSEELTPLIAIEAHKMAEHYTTESEAKAAVKLAKENLKKAKENFKVVIAAHPKESQAVKEAREKIVNAKGELTKAIEKFRASNITNYAWSRLITAPWLSSENTESGINRTVASYNAGRLMNAKGKPRERAICSEMVAQIAIGAQIAQSGVKQGDLTRKTLIELQAKGQVQNLDSHRVTPRYVTESLEKIGFNCKVITLEAYQKGGDDYDSLIGIKQPIKGEGRQPHDQGRHQYV